MKVMCAVEVQCMYYSTVQVQVLRATEMHCILCYMELREGDVAENQNIRFSRGAAKYSLTG